MQPFLRAVEEEAQISDPLKTLDMFGYKNMLWRQASTQAARAYSPHGRG